MASSGTTAFSLDILEIVEEAFEMTGVESRNGYDLKTARRSLDLLMREWGNRGINFWTIKESSEAVAADQSSITLDADTIDILDAVWRTGTGQSQHDGPFTRIGIDEFANIANKNNPGSPSLVWVNRVVPPVANIWPIPVEAGTFVYWKLRRIEDAGAYTNTVDVPPRFLPAMTSGLAYYLAIKTPSAAERIPMLQQEYERQFGLASDEDRERASVYLVPDLNGY